MKLRKTHDGKGCASSATAGKEPELLSIQPESAELLTSPFAWDATASRGVNALV